MNLLTRETEFLKFYHRKYNHDNKQRINEKVEKNKKYQYNNDEDYRTHKIEQILKL
jgi:hypothetical protein